MTLDHFEDRGSANWEPYQRADHSHTHSHPPDHDHKKDLPLLNKQIGHLYYRLGCLTWIVSILALTLLLLLGLELGWVPR